MSLRLAGLALLLSAGCAPAAPGATPGKPAASSGPTALVDRPAASSGPVASVALAERDTDGDGIPDIRDQCPGQAEDCDGFEDEDGCPDLDNDKDTIADACDRCPLVPGGGPDGCELFIVLAVNQEIKILEVVLFPRGSAVPLKASLPLFDEVARVMKTSPEIELLEALGHASEDEPGGQKLSEQRAKAARAMLLARGVAPGRVVARGVGFSRPRAPNDQEASRALNRRVEWPILRSTRPSGPPAQRKPPRVAAPGEAPICPGLTAVPAPLPPPPGGCPKSPPGP